MEIPARAIDLAEEEYRALPGILGERREAPMARAIRRALEIMALRTEYAVPRLDKDKCRTLFGEDREAAEAHARKHGGVLETRLALPWRPER